MVIWYEFRMGQYWDDDNREDEAQFIYHMLDRKDSMVIF